MQREVDLAKKVGLPFDKDFKLMLCLLVVKVERCRCFGCTKLEIPFLEIGKWDYLVLIKSPL